MEESCAGIACWLTSARETQRTPAERRSHVASAVTLAVKTDDLREVTSSLKVESKKP